MEYCNEPGKNLYLIFKGIDTLIFFPIDIKITLSLSTKYPSSLGSVVGLSFALLNHYGIKTQVNM